MSDEREKWAEIGVASQQAVDAVRELGHLLRQLADSWSSSVAKAAADQMEPATATSPPEPQWKPGQLVTLAVGASGPPTHVGYRRQSGGWHIFSDGYDTVISDETARNVEPVTVLTAEDARGVAARVAQRMVASGISDGLWTQVAGEAVEDEFRERGLDL